MRKKRRSLKLFLFLIFLFVFGALLPNYVLAPRLKDKIVKSLNRKGERSGTVGTVRINLLTGNLTILAGTVRQKGDAVSMRGAFPSIEIHTSLFCLLTGEIMPRSIIFREPDIILEDPPTPVAQAVPKDIPLRLATASMFPNFTPMLVSKSKKKWLNGETVDRIVIKNGKVTYSLDDPKETPFSTTLERISAEARDLTFSPDGDVESVILRSLEVYWPGGDAPLISYSGRFEKRDGKDSAQLVGAISKFPLKVAGAPLEKKYGVKILDGTLDLASALSYEGTVLDSTHTLTLRGLKISSKDADEDESKLDVGALVIQVLDLASDEDGQEIRDIHLQADFREDPKDALDKMARDGLSQVLDKLSKDLLYQMQKNPDGIKDKLKEIGKSLLEKL